MWRLQTAFELDARPDRRMGWLLLRDARSETGRGPLMALKAHKAPIHLVRWTASLGF